MRFVAHVELAAAAKMRIVVSAGSVAICPACGIEKGAHSKSRTVGAVASIMCQWLRCLRSARIIRADSPRIFVTVAALYCVGTPDVEFTPRAENLADRE